jgi:hypothetical protein
MQSRPRPIHSLAVLRGRSHGLAAGTEDSDLLGHVLFSHRSCQSTGLALAWQAKNGLRPPPQGRLDLSRGVALSASSTHSRDGRWVLHRHRRTPSQRPPHDTNPRIASSQPACLQYRTCDHPRMRLLVSGDPGLDVTGADMRAGGHVCEALCSPNGLGKLSIRPDIDEPRPDFSWFRGGFASCSKPRFPPGKPWRSGSLVATYLTLFVALLSNMAVCLLLAQHCYGSHTSSLLLQGLGCTMARHKHHQALARQVPSP